MIHWGRRYLALLFGCGALVFAQDAGAACQVEASVSGASSPLVKKLLPGCTEAERETHTVSSATITEALERGQAVELAGVIVHGDLIFDRLPLQTVKMKPGATSERQEPSNQPSGQELRLVQGMLTISDSVVLGAVRHRSAQGTLQFDGPVDFHGTTFKEGVDLSRTRFQGIVDLSGVVFQKEAFFVQGQFTRSLACREAKFGPHTRFHRAMFHGPVDCTGALFDGLAEFLEVTFQQPTLFERVRFGSGTGFSGGRFAQQVSFHEAIFSRDTFFGFAVFEGAASFAGAQFLGKADFSDAEFKQPDDLATARFDQSPLLVRTQRAVQDQPDKGANLPIGQYALTVGLLFLAAMLLAYALKRK
ncbi:MAG: pentapeptide repeat-containing protein [Nitrospira sp.]|nr:pentapeptide repeat-containing protein [Nitrospira sp.]